MTDADAPPAAPAPTLAATALADHIRAKLAGATAPLKFADVKKGLKKPPKVSPAVFDATIREVLVGEERAGRAFAYPSGPKGAERYWGRDEKHALREAALEAAETPLTLADLAKRVKPVCSADAAFVDGLLRELISEDRLFEHPPAGKGKAAKARFGTTAPPPPPPPPHPLEVGKNKTAFAKLVEAARKLSQTAQVSSGELLDLLREKLADSPSPDDQQSRRPEPAAAPAPTAEPVVVPSAGELGELILRAIGTAPVASLADLRRAMRPEHRGRPFDEAVLRLDDEQRVVLHQDANPARYTDTERAEFVADGSVLFTSISKRDGT